jgi:hypothetical protein
MDDLLIKYILEEASPEESEQVQQWLAADAANRARFEKLQAVWQLAAPLLLQPATDPSPALQRLKQTLQVRETPVKRIWPRIWTAAAALVGIVGMALGAYVLIKPKTTVKEHPPVVQPDKVQHRPLPVDTTPTVPAMQPVPALPTDTIPLVKPHKKKRPEPVRPVEPVRPKKKTAQQPVHPVDSRPVKKKRPEPVRPVQPVRPKKKRPEQPATRPLPPKKKKGNRQPPIT